MAGSNEPSGGRDCSLSKLDRLTGQVSILNVMVMMTMAMKVMVPFLNFIIIIIIIIKS